MQTTKKIIGESFFHEIPKNHILVESDFVRLDKSIIWKCSELFWKYFNVWEDTYGEDFESSLPSGMSESHNPEFIISSAERFLKCMHELDSKNQLQDTIYVYEQGPGTGVFAKGFLDYIKERDKKCYKKIIYILTDTSQEILATCKSVLRDHKNNTKFFEQNEFENSNIYNGKILFVRHSNVWDGWPCRNIRIRQSGLGEVYVRAVCDSKFEKFVEDMRADGLETAILHNKNDWKEFFRSIKLQKRTIPFYKIDLEQEPYFQYLQENIGKHNGTNTLLSAQIIHNLSFLDKLINWENGGYAEIVDIITTHPRKLTPKKFDGSVAYIIDGNSIVHWAKESKKELTFTSLRKLNTMVTITKNATLKQANDVLQNITYEVYPTDKTLEESTSFPKKTHIAVTCTSKKGIDYTIDTTIQLRQRGLNAYPHIVARHIIDEENLIIIKNKLAKNNLQEIFVAGGDIDDAAGEFQSAMDLLHGFKQVGIPYKTLAVTGYPEGHPKIPDEKLLTALQDKQEFAEQNNVHTRIVTQMCFDADTIVGWALELQKEGIMLPVVVGIPGPCNLLQLIQFAKKCGVGQSFKFLTSKKTLGKNLLMNMAIQYTPDKLIEDILQHPLFTKVNISGFHIYTFNNIDGVFKWQENFLKQMEQQNN